MMTAPGQTWSSQPYTDHISAGPAAYSSDAFDDAVKHTQQPIVTGSSILALRYKDGIMMASDTLASYGSLARFMDVRRIIHVEGANSLVGAGGDMSDFQYIQHTIDKLMLDEFSAGDAHTLTPPQLYRSLSRMMYNRRSKVDPLWNSLVLAGVDPTTGVSFLGYVDLLGTTYQSSTIATGFGLHLAQPLLRKAVEGRENQIEEAEAHHILENCMKVLFYRDARSLNRFQIAKITKSGATISEPQSVATEWGFAEGLRGYGPQTQ